MTESVKDTIQNSGAGRTDAVPPEAEQGIPTIPEVPVTPAEPETPEEPYSAEAPAEPEMPAEPETPEEPYSAEAPTEPETPEEPETTEEPGTQEEPETTEEPETPDDSETAEVQETPGRPKKKRRKPIAVPPMPVWGRVLCALYWACVAGFLLSQTKTVLGTLVFGETEVEGGQWVLLALWAAVLLSAVLSLAVLRPARLRYALRKKRKRKRRLRWYHIPLMLMLDIYVFLIIEYVNNEKFLEMEWYYMLLNVAGILIIHILVFLLLNSLKLSMLVILAVWSVFAIAFYMVYLFRGEPLQLIDILSIGTALEVAGNYKPVITRAIAVDIVGFFCLTPLIVQGKDACLAKKKIGKILIRVILVGMLIGVFQTLVRF